MSLNWLEVVMELRSPGSVCLAERIIRHGPVFTQEPSDSVFPLRADDNKIFINCKAKGNPVPHYRWKFNGRDLTLDSDLNYSLVEGNLLINNPQALKHGGVYQCIASNTFGSILSREATVQFAYLQNFSSKARGPVSVRKGQAVVLLCGPPPHFGALGQSSTAPYFRTPQAVVSHNGLLFSSDTCIQTPTSWHLSPRTPPPLVLMPLVSLRSFGKVIFLSPGLLLVGNKGVVERQAPLSLSFRPVPAISWRRADGSPFPGKMKINHSNGVLEIPYFRPEDAGVYECVAENSRGRSVSKGHLIFYGKSSSETVNDAYTAIEDDLHWDCRANGKPPPVYRWLKNGHTLESQVRRPTLLDNTQNYLEFNYYLQHGSRSITGGTLLHQAVMYLRWRDCGEHLSCWSFSFRWTVLEDGTLRITNVSEGDAGRYTCVARNPFGTASSSGTLVVKEPTKITVPPLSMDATVGESIVLPCEVSRDSGVDPTFKWFFNGKLIDFSRHEHFEMIGGGSSGDLMVRNIQLKHSGKYVCMVHTAVDSVSAAADLIVRGPPGAPEGVVVRDVTDRTAQISWGPGSDNHSPVTLYILQTRTAFSIGWQAVTTVYLNICKFSFILCVLCVFMCFLCFYVFFVFFGLKAPEVAPANVSGGGGSRGELVIVWEPVPEELQNGGEFGYVVAFRLLGSPVWIQSVVPSVDASRYVFKNDSIPPLSRFEVKVGVYNSMGEGPFSPEVIVYSAEEGEERFMLGLSAVLCVGLQQVSSSSARITGLKGSTRYRVTVRATNSGGAGPASAPVNITTKKPPPSQPPGNIEWNLTNSKVFLNWEQVKAMENESEVTGYKVVYRQNWRRRMNVVETNRTSVELHIPSGEDLLIQIKASSDGGDGSYSSPIRIPKMSSRCSPIILNHKTIILIVFHCLSVQIESSSV
uniref:Contactin 4 n=1 Tax=Astyanax mexicanus TaxID=7994 RepID=A0A8B9H6I1_ASTMX